MAAKSASCHGVAPAIMDHCCSRRHSSLPVPAIFSQWYKTQGRSAETAACRHCHPEIVSLETGAVLRAAAGECRCNIEAVDDVSASALATPKIKPKCGHFAPHTHQQHAEQQNILEHPGLQAESRFVATEYSLVFGMHTCAGGQVAQIAAHSGYADCCFLHSASKYLQADS